MKKVNQHYTIEGTALIEQIIAHLTAEDIPYSWRMVDNDSAAFEIVFYSAGERDEFDNWISEQEN